MQLFVDTKNILYSNGLKFKQHGIISIRRNQVIIDIESKLERLYARQAQLNMLDEGCEPNLPNILSTIQLPFYVIFLRAGNNTKLKGNVTRHNKCIIKFLLSPN